jgi:tetratricopeptide (TPR) repeat protein
VRAAIFLTLAVAFFAGVTRGENVPTARQAWDIPKLVAALSDPDPGVRTEAAMRLEHIGAPARAAVLKATKSDDPEQRSRAAQVLRKLPWWTEDDPPAVRALLGHYGNEGDGDAAIIGGPGASERAFEVIRQLDEINAFDALLRLLNEEPTDSIRWQIVVELLGNGAARTNPAVRELKPADDDAASLMLSGATWLPFDKTRALGLLRRAIDADQRRPSNDGGVLAFAYEQLVDAAIDAADLTGAADLLRREIPRDGIARWRRYRRTEGSHPSLAKLAALHAYFGPFAGYDDDASAAADAVESLTTVLENISQLFAQLGQPVPLPTDDTASLGPDDRYVAAQFLQQHDFLDAAEMELTSAIAAKKASTTDQNVFDANYLLLLARVAGQQENDDLAVACYERSLRIQAGGDLSYDPNDPQADAERRREVQAQLLYRKARSAQKRGDVAAADKQVKQLLDLPMGNTDSSIDAVRWLKETSRAAEAKQVFDRIYADAKAKLDAAPQPLKAEARNNLAWLCARCGERMDEAVDLARLATRDEPDNSAYLDTLAEANYRAGRATEAIRIEKRALELSPNNKFMIEQIERFKAGKP